MMAMAVRWVYRIDTHKGIPMEAGQKPALCFKGHKYMLCVVAGYPVRVLKRPVKDFETARVVTTKGVEYTVERAVAQFRAIGERNGITQAASTLLDKAASGKNGIDENQFNDEEDMEKPADEVVAPEVTTDETTAAPVDTVAAPKPKRVRKPKATTAAVTKPEETKPTPTTNEETDMSKKSTTKAKKPAAKKTKKAAAPRAAKGPSRISKAVEYMRDEVKKAGGFDKLEHGFRKDLFARAAKKFDLSPITCSIQYGRQVLNKPKK